MSRRFGAHCGSGTDRMIIFVPVRLVEEIHCRWMATWYLIVWLRQGRQLNCQADMDTECGARIKASVQLPKGSTLRHSLNRSSSTYRSRPCLILAFSFLTLLLLDKLSLSHLNRQTIIKHTACYATFIERISNHIWELRDWITFSRLGKFSPYMSLDLSILRTL